jgi:hypothetical protein
MTPWLALIQFARVGPDCTLVFENRSVVSSTFDELQTNGV